MLVGPFLDHYISASWVWDFQFTTINLLLTAVSCIMAVLVNLSQFMCLGRFSAVSYQVNHLNMHLVKRFAAEQML